MTMMMTMMMITDVSLFGISTNFCVHLWKTHLSRVDLFKRPDDVIHQ
jgi:hypothetical protein